VCKSVFGWPLTRSAAAWFSLFVIPRRTRRENRNDGRRSQDGTDEFAAQGRDGRGCRFSAGRCLERLNKEIKRGTNVVGIFPNPDSIARLVGSMLSEQHDERQVSKRSFNADSMAKVTGRFEEIHLPLAGAR